MEGADKMIKQRLKTAICAFLVLILLCALVGCSDANRLYHDEIGVEQIGSPYIPEHIFFDNDWLQKKSLSAAEGLNLQKTTDFFAYLNKIEPILLRYFIRNYELTDIMHYSNGIWAVRYVLPEERICVLGSDYDVEIYYISETTGEIYNYECWSREGTKAWE